MSGHQVGGSLYPMVKTVMRRDDARTPHAELITPQPDESGLRRP
ncbi:hypothetical protein [Paenibacillus mucilaginosus]